MYAKNLKSLKIAYFLITDIQHFPPILRLLPLLGGIIITSNKAIYNYIQKKYPDLNFPVYLVKNNNQARKILFKHRIRMVIYPGFNTLYFGKSVQIFHGGLSDKNYVESLLILMYNLVLFPGEKTRDKVEKSGYLKFIPKWDIVGYPKFDPLINHKLETSYIFTNGRKTILYAPTWESDQHTTNFVKFSPYGETSINLWAKEIIQSLHKDYNLIIIFMYKLII